MRRFLLTTMIAMLIIPLFYFSIPSTEAQLDIVPFTPHEVKVLVVSHANLYSKGGHYLISDLARYGFNVTQHTSDKVTAVNYLTDPLTSDLSQYDVVILHGSYIPHPPITLKIDEVNHFTNYNGTLIVIGNALFWNETTPQTYWNTFFGSAHHLKLEQRLGVDFTAWLKGVGADYKHNNGSFTLTDDSISGLPPNLTYIAHDPNWINYQVVATPKEGREIYDFTTEKDITTSGVTYYENATGAVGIYIQGSYIYSPPEDYDLRRIRYFGLTDISKRSSLLASLIAYSHRADINTVIKSQPLATIRLDRLGTVGWGEPYLNTSLINFNSLVDLYGIMPTIGFTDFLYESYWQNTAPDILSQLRSKYRDWEYASSLWRLNGDLTSMNQSEIELLMRNVKANYTALRMDLFSTVAILANGWNQTTLLDAMAGENLTLLDTSARTTDYGSLDWWNLRVLSKIISHRGAQMGWIVDAETFSSINSTDPNDAMNKLHYEYFRDRDKWALAVVNGFPSFVYSIWHFAQNEVGTYSLKTVYSNLTSEFPDIRFVPLIEAGLYFGNKWARVKNPQRVGSIVEFDVDSSAIPYVVSIGKGMLWLRIGTDETIRGVSIDGKPWFYFDDHTIRIPAELAHVVVTLGERVYPTVIRTVYEVTETRWEDERFTVSVSATQGLNVSIGLFIPLWDAFCSETLWGYRFNAATQVLEFWAIQDDDGIIVFDVGADVTPPVMRIVSRSPTWYNTSVTITMNFTDLGTGMRTAILGYSIDSEWINVTMVTEDSLYVGIIPAFSYGTVVQFRLYGSDNAGNWRISENFGYNVTDEIPPEIEVSEWDASSPSAGQPVIVRVSAVEPKNASGLDLDSVMLWFFLDDDSSTHKNITMTYDEGLWLAEIPGQSGGKVVSFHIEAKDKAGNLGASKDHSYKVEGAGSLPWYMLAFGLVVTTIGIGAGLYLIKFRKAREKKD